MPVNARTSRPRPGSPEGTVNSRFAGAFGEAAAGGRIKRPSGAGGTPGPPPVRVLTPQGAAGRVRQRSVSGARWLALFLVAVT